MSYMKSCHYTTQQMHSVGQESLRKLSFYYLIFIIYLFTHFHHMVWDTLLSGAPIHRDVAKKKFSRLRYPLSRLTLEGTCAFCVGAADTTPSHLGGPGGLPREILKI